MTNPRDLSGAVALNAAMLRSVAQELEKQADTFAQTALMMANADGDAAQLSALASAGITEENLPEIMHALFSDGRKCLASIQQQLTYSIERFDVVIQTLSERIK